MTNSDFQNDAWMNLLATVAALDDGEIIRHEWLKKQFNIPQPTFEQYGNEVDFLKAVDMAQFEYMSMVDRLRDDLLKTHSVCIKNERGIGYSIVPPQEQVTFAYDRLSSEIKKALRVAGLICSNVRSYPDFAQRAKDNDIRSKVGAMKTFLTSLQ